MKIETYIDSLVRRYSFRAIKGHVFSTEIPVQPSYRTTSVQLSLKRGANSNRQAMPTGTHTAQTLVEAACPKPHADVVSWATQPFGLRQRD